MTASTHSTHVSTAYNSTPLCTACRASRRTPTALLVHMYYVYLYVCLSVYTYVCLSVCAATHPPHAAAWRQVLASSSISDSRLSSGRGGEGEDEAFMTARHTAHTPNTSANSLQFLVHTQSISHTHPTLSQLLHATGHSSMQLPVGHRACTTQDTVPPEGCPVPSLTASSCLSLCRRAGGRTWSDEVLDTVSVATEAGHVDGEHAIGTMPVGGGGAGGGDRQRKG